MIYRFSFTIPANTTEDNKIRTDIKLTKGIVHQIDIVFPPGCFALAKIAINDGLHQVWPSNPGQYFASDGEVISFKEFYELREEPHTLAVFTYNLDDTYSHTLVLRLGVLRRDELQGVWIPWSEEILTME